MSFRICSSVLSYNNRLVQSYNFNMLRYLGERKGVLSFLDSYQTDEIHYLNIVKGNSIKPDLDNFKSLSTIPITTPLAIGGGVNHQVLEELIEDPFFERVIVNSALFDDKKLIQKLHRNMGLQAVVAYIPVMVVDNEPRVYYSRENKFIGVPEGFFSRVSDVVNEVVLLDAKNEGMKRGFSFNILGHIDISLDRVLISGGIMLDDLPKAKSLGLAGVSLDNLTLHSEFSIARLRK